MNAHLAARAHPRPTVFTLQRQFVPLAALAAAMACLAVATDARAQARPTIAAHAPGAPQFVAGRILVQPRAGLSDKELDKILEPHGGKRAKHIKPINVHVVDLPEKAWAGFVADSGVSLNSLMFPSRARTRKSVSKERSRPSLRSAQAATQASANPSGRSA